MRETSHSFLQPPVCSQLHKKYRLLKNDNYFTYNWLRSHKYEICSQIVVKYKGVIETIRLAKKKYKKYIHEIINIT